MEHIVNPFLARQESYHNVLSCGEQLYLGGGGLYALLGMITLWGYIRFLAPSRAETKT